MTKKMGYNYHKKEQTNMLRFARNLEISRSTCNICRKKHYIFMVRGLILYLIHTEHTT